MSTRLPLVLLGLAALVIASACTRSTSGPPSTPPSEAAPPAAAATPPAADSGPEPAAEAAPAPSEAPPDADPPPTNGASDAAADPLSSGQPQAKAAVQGPLDKDIVRRIVRAHMNEIRFCYNKALQKEPELRGRATVRFAIGADGTVQATERVEVDPESDGMIAVADCAALAIRRWTFPKTEGGASTLVTYPFSFEPG